MKRRMMVLAGSLLLLGLGLAVPEGSSAAAADCCCYQYSCDLVSDCPGICSICDEYPQDVYYQHCLDHRY